MSSPAKKSNKSLTSENLIPPQFSYIFEQKPVLWCEDEAVYCRLLADFLTELNPSTVLEFHWVKNIADIQWEIMRCQRLRSAGLVAEMPEATRYYLGNEFHRQAQVLGLDGGEDALSRVIRLAARGNKWSQDKVAQMVDGSGVTYDSLLYKSYAAAASTLADISNRLLKLEQRRDDLIRRFEERRRSLSAHRKSLLDEGRGGDIVDVDQVAHNGEKS